MTKERYAQVPMDDDAELKELFEHLCTEKGVDSATTRTELKANSKVTIPSLQKLGKKLGIKLVFDYSKNFIEGHYTIEVGEKKNPVAEVPMAPVPPEEPVVEEPQAEAPATEPPAPATMEVPAATPAPPVQGEVPATTPGAPVAPAAPEAPTPPVVAPVAPPARPTAAETPVAPSEAPVAPAEVPGADQSLVQPDVPVAAEAPATPPAGGDPAFKTVKDPDVTGEDSKDDDLF